MAETFTNKLKLTKRDSGDLNWAEGANSNLDLLDAHSQQGSLRPPRTLLATLGAGGVGGELLGSTTYYFKITAINEGESTESQIPVVLEAQATEPATPVPIVLTWETVPGATGYRIYKSTASGQEKFLIEKSGQATSTHTDDGNTAVQTGISVPTTNDAYTAVQQLIAGANIVLTPSHGKGIVTVESSGGGAAGDGYANVTVAAPTGTAATDKANIQSALNSIGVSGGTVQLREGTYVIDGKLTIKNDTHLRGRGKNATILENQDDALIFDGGINNVTIEDLSIEAQGIQGSGSIIDDSVSSVDDITFINCKFTGEVSLDQNSNGWQNIHFFGCRFELQGSTMLLGDAASTEWRFHDCYIEADQITVNGDRFHFTNCRMISDSDGNTLFETILSNSIIVGNVLEHSSNSGDNLIDIQGNNNNFSNNYIKNASANATGITIQSGDNIISFNDVVEGIDIQNGVQNCIVVGNRGTVSDSGTNNIVSDGSGGAVGPVGYATVVVAAPTGNQTTDRNNLVAALGTGAGTVILREGNYDIATPVTPLSRQIIIGQGRDTTELSNTTDGLIFNGNPNEVTLRDMSILCQNLSANAIFNDTSSNPTDWTFENIKFSDELALDNSDNGWQGLEFRNCLFENNSPCELGLSTSKHWKFENCRFNVDEAIITGEQFSIINNRFIQSGGGTAGLTADLTDSRIIGNYMEIINAGNDVLDLQQGSGVTVVGNTFRNSGGAGTSSIFLGDSLSDSIINSNDCSDGIQFSVGTTGCTVVGNKGTITLNGATGNVVAENFVTGLRKTGEASFLDGGVELEEGTNITLTQDGPSKKITIAAAGGGGGASGYATAVVDAATGVAATDQANIAAALSAASSAGGGIVQLREGTYNINATLSMGTNVTLQGQGRTATVILADPTMGAVSMFSSSGSGQVLRDLTVDENEPNRGSGPFIGSLFNSSNVLIENCKFTRNKSGGSFVFIGSGTPGNGGMMRNCIIDNNGNALSTAIVQGGQQIDNCTIFQNQSGNVNDFIQSPGQVMNCSLYQNQGTLSGAGIRAQTNDVIMGNTLFTGSANNAIIVAGNSASYIGNICQGGGKITLNSGAANNTIIGNVSTTIVDNSGQSNVIANNS